MLAGNDDVDASLTWCWCAGWADDDADLCIKNMFFLLYHKKPNYFYIIEARTCLHVLTRPDIGSENIHAHGIIGL